MSRIRTHARQKTFARLEAMEIRRLLAAVVVDTLADETVANATTSLREAIQLAGNNDTIQFQSGLTGQIVLNGTELMITKNLTIAGPGADKLAISGGDVSRVLSIQPGITVGISQITIRDGRNAAGAGILVLHGGTLTLNKVTLSDNTAVGGRNPDGGGTEGSGGAIHNAGWLNIIDSQIRDNTAAGGDGGLGAGPGDGGDATGGAIFNDLNAVLVVSGTTFSQNVAISGVPLAGGAEGGSAGNAQGGAVLNLGNATFTQCTFSNNRSQGLDGADGELTAGSGGRAFGGAITSGGPLEIVASTFTGNAALAGNGGMVPGTGLFTDGGDALGGAINASDALKIDASTFAANYAIAGNKMGAHGGAIASFGVLTMTSSTVAGNTAKGDPDADDSRGELGGGAVAGGIQIGGGGDNVIAGSTVMDNQAIGGPGGAGYHLHGNDYPSQSGGMAEGGGLFVGAPLTITNSTIASNTARGGAGGAFDLASASPGAIGGNAYGGGIFIAPSVTLTATSVTVAGNKAIAGAGGAGGSGLPAGAPGNSAGGGVRVIAGGPFVPRNVIVAGNTADSGPDVAGPVTSGGFNLIGKSDQSTGWIASDLRGTIAAPLDAKLAAPAYNGGQTKTMLPLAGSPAIDKGKAFALTSDQRGEPRTADQPAVANAAGGDGTDIGAVELAATPFAGTIISASAPTTIQLEDFDAGAEGVAYHDVDSANLGKSYRDTGVDIQPTTDTGGGFNVGWTRAGEWLKYSVSVTQAGAYDLAFRVASSGAGGKFHLELDGQNISGLLSVPNTGAWQNWTTLTRTGVNLPAGNHVLRLVMDSVGASGAIGNFNALTVSPASTAATVISATEETTLQAEDFDAGAEGIAYHDVDAANLGGAYRQTGVDIQATTDPGGGFNVGWTKKGEWLKYTVSVTKAGKYDFSFRVASNGVGGQFHLELDGQNLTGPMNISSTGDWQSFKTITKTGLKLPAGVHVLRLVMDSVGPTGSVGNFNFIKVAPASTSQVEVTVNTYDAAHVRDGSYRGVNFGSSPTLEVKKSTIGYNREAFLKFDLSAGYSISGAKLRLFGGLTDTAASQISLGVYDVTSENWTESAITWDNKPATGASVATATIAGTTAKWYEIDLTNYIKAELAAGREVVTLALRSNTSTSTLCQFNSDEAATNRPQMVLSIT